MALHDLVSGFIHSLDDDHFAVLQIIVPATGSLVLGLAFVEGAITAEEAFAAIRVEENYKAALYNEALHGPDPAQEKKDHAIMSDLKACAEFLSLLG
jgi:chaperone required for assembly of F1-ATPase